MRWTIGGGTRFCPHCGAPATGGSQPVLETVLEIKAVELGTKWGAGAVLGNLVFGSRPVSPCCFVARFVENNPYAFDVLARFQFPKLYATTIEDMRGIDREEAQKLLAQIHEEVLTKLGFQRRSMGYAWYSYRYGIPQDALPAEEERHQAKTVDGRVWTVTNLRLVAGPLEAPTWYANWFSLPDGKARGNRIELKFAAEKDVKLEFATGEQARAFAAECPI